MFGLIWFFIHRKLSRQQSQQQPRVAPRDSWQLGFWSVGCRVVNIWCSSLILLLNKCSHFRERPDESTVSPSVLSSTLPGPGRGFGSALCLCSLVTLRNTWFTVQLPEVRFLHTLRCGRKLDTMTHNEGGNQGSKARQIFCNGPRQIFEDFSNWDSNQVSVLASCTWKSFVVEMSL